tara:strand:+ start:1666 stop:1827 length:162 start_codon:yes stop_codon:yes gene_type:complete
LDTIPFGDALLRPADNHTLNVCNQLEGLIDGTIVTARGDQLTMAIEIELALLG